MIGDGFPSSAFDRLFDPPCEPECVCPCVGGTIFILNPLGMDEEEIETKCTCECHEVVDHLD